MPGPAVAQEQVVEPFPEPAKAPSGDAQAHALQAFAEATNRLAAAIEGFRPAADTVHGMGERLDALCAWLKSKWPWIALAGYLLLSRVVEKPEDLLELAKAAVALVGPK